MIQDTSGSLSHALLVLSDLVLKSLSANPDSIDKINKIPGFMGDSTFRYTLYTLPHSRTNLEYDYGCACLIYCFIPLCA